MTKLDYSPGDGRHYVLDDEGAEIGYVARPHGTGSSWIAKHYRTPTPSPRPPYRTKAAAVDYVVRAERAYFDTKENAR